jgi:hypothetical protein
MELIDQEIAEDELEEDRAARLMQEDALGPRRTGEGRPSAGERQAEGSRQAGWRVIALSCVEKFGLQCVGVRFSLAGEPF